MPDPAEATRGVAAHYSSKADAFARYWAPVLRPMGERLLEALPLAGARIVADLGAGSGALLPRLRAKERNALVVGVDVAEGMLELAAATGAAVAVSDLRHLALGEGAIDVAVSCFVLHRLPDLDAAMREVNRALRPGGTFGTVGWARGGGDRWAMTVCYEELEATGAPHVGGHAFRRSDGTDTPEAVGGLLERNGFEAVSAWRETIEQRWTPDEVVERWIGWGAGERLESLPTEDRRACLDRVRERLAELDADAFVYRPNVVLTTARRPS